MTRKIVALAALLWPALAFGQAHNLGSGAQITPRGSEPIATSGNGILWIDKNAGNALTYTGPSGVRFNLALTGAKGSIPAHTGTAWSTVGVGANGFCLKADDAQATGLVWGSCGGGGSSTLSGAYNTGASQTDSTLNLDSTRRGLRIRDNATPLVTALFSVQNSIGSTEFFNVTNYGLFASQSVFSGVTPGSMLALFPQSHTAITASTEWMPYRLAASSPTWSAGSLASERWVGISAPTLNFTGPSTVATATTLSIAGAPVAGTNATITNAYSMHVESGLTNLAGSVITPSIGTSSTSLHAMPSGTGAIMTTDATQSVTGKTFITPVIDSPTFNGVIGGLLTINAQRFESFNATIAASGVQDVGTITPPLSANSLILFCDYGWYYNDGADRMAAMGFSVTYRKVAGTWTKIGIDGVNTGHTSNSYATQLHGPGSSAESAGNIKVQLLMGSSTSTTVRASCREMWL